MRIKVQEQILFLGLQLQFNFIKISNKMIIQWGIANYSTLVSQAVFPISFTNLNYVAIVTAIIEDSSNAFTRGFLFQHKSLTGCLFRASENGGPASMWLAIGN